MKLFNFRDKTLIAGTVVIAGAGMLAGALSHAATIQNFESPGSGTPYELSGFPDPVLVTEGLNSFARLAAVNDRAAQGEMAFEQTDSGQFSKIVADFDFRQFGAGADEPPADGFGFALLNTSWYRPVGNAGQHSPDAEEPKFVNSLSVGYDIFQGEDESNSNSISIYLNQEQVQSAVFGIPLWSSSEEAMLHSQIIVDFINQKVTVNVAGESNVFSVPGLASYESRVWFGARNGAFTANHDIDNVNVVYTPLESPGNPVPEPGSAALLSLGLLGFAAARAKRRKSGVTGAGHTGD